MSAKKLVIPIFNGEDKIELALYAEQSSSLEEKADAIENGEALIQVKEGCLYEYKIDDGFLLRPSEIVAQSKISDTSGRIMPSIYVGTLTIDVLESSSQEKCA